MPWRLDGRCALVALAALSSFASPACFRQIPVRPDELPKLNGADAATATGHTVSGAPVVGLAPSTRHLIRPDGRVARVTGRPGVIIRTSRGEYYFHHPVLAAVEADTLELRGSNRGLKRFELAEVLEARVRVPDVGAMLAWVCGLGGVALIISAIVIFAPPP